MTDRLRELSKDSVIPISLGLLIAVFSALCVGVWNLAGEIGAWKNRMDSFESRLETTLGNQWSYFMARESWKELKQMNPELTVPDVENIRRAYSTATR